MHRTQIYLNEDQIRRLRMEAKKEHAASISDLIRKAIDAYLESRQRKINWDKDPLTKAAGEIKLSVTDASEQHDRYLYG